MSEAQAQQIKETNEEDWTKGKNPWLLALPTIFAAFMFVLDETIANVALPYMAGTFSVSREESTWILTSYLVASGITIPTVGWFSKLLGRKNFFCISLLVFIGASFACGISTSLGAMVLARIAQGFGGGSLLPISQAIMLEAFPKEQRGVAMAAFGMVVVTAPIIGPVVGGYITTNMSWHWIFFINLPIGIFAFFLARYLLEDPPYARKQSGVSIDGWGFFFLTVWLATLQVVLDKGNNADWFHAAWVVRVSIISVISLIMFVTIQLNSKKPLIDLSVFKDRNYLIGTFVQVIMQAILLGSLAILPQFLQMMLGYDAFLSGLTVMPRGFGAMTATILYAIFSNKVDNRILCAIGVILMGIAGLSFGFLNLDIATINVAIPNYIYGLGMALAMIPIITLSVITLKNEQMTNASGLQNLVKNVGGAIGTSIVTTMISRFSQMHQFMLVKNLTDLNPEFVARVAATKGALMQYATESVAEYMAQYSQYGALIKQSTLFGFIDAFRVFGLLAFSLVPLFFLLRVPKDTNKES